MGLLCPITMQRHLSVPVHSTVVAARELVGNFCEEQGSTSNFDGIEYRKHYPV